MYSPPPHNEPQLLSLITPGDIAIDIGANVGAWTYELLQRFKTVYACEPQQECFVDLRKLVDEYGPRVQIHRFAAWQNNGELLMQVRGGSGMSNICGTNPQTDPGPVIAEYAVYCQPFDHISNKLGGSVDFVKIDTEGAEVEVLKGLQTTITRHRPSLMVEYHACENRDWIITWLGKRGYAVRDIPINTELGWIHAPRPDSWK